MLDVVNDRLRNKIGLVTGAASGIGLATSKMLMKQGAIVIMSDLPSSQEIMEDMQLGKNVPFGILDVTVESDWATVLNEIKLKYGKLDFLVNNAGIGTPGSIEETTLEQWRRIHSVNSEGPFLGCKYGISLMKQNPQGGSIINVSSVAGIIGSPNLAAYCSSKGAVRLLTKSVALHCARKGYGIRCNSVHPSYTDTPMVDSMVTNHRSPERYRAALETASPTGRLATPNDIAGAIVYLASDESSFTTGSEIIVDGGLTAT
ncbi:MAG: 3-beta hydroxysteroid dehydrogenase [Rhodospirillaceae bacterium]|nr:3-beta hydroxysteroid dehydrogenase [Rhodospirillaceae bacterium]